MTEVSGVYLPVGTRYANIWELNERGRPNAESALNSYIGHQAQGAKGLTITIPEPRKITHAGDDRPLAIDFLPALEAGSAELHVAKSDLALQAILSGAKVSVIGESQGLWYGTNKQGYEPVVGLMVYQQALDASDDTGINGLRRWRSIWVPKAKLILQPHGTDDNAADLVYKIAPNIVRAHLWGTALTELEDGTVEGQFHERMFEGIPFLDSWLGAATTSQSASDSESGAASESKSPSHSASPSTGAGAGALTLTHTALSTDKIVVFVDGVERTTGVNKTTTYVEFYSNPPEDTSDVNILYEY